MTIAWPANLVPADVDAHIVPYNTSGGVGFDNSEQVIGNTPGRVRVIMNNIYLSNATQIQRWRQTANYLNGRANAALIPIYDSLRAPWPVGADGVKVKDYGKLSHADRSLFSDGTGYEQPVISSTAYAAVPSGAVAAQINVIGGSKLTYGQWFGDVSNQRIYQIWRVKSATVIKGGYLYTVYFNPPVREPISKGAVIEFGNPLVRCRLETDDAMLLKNGLQLWRRAAPSLTWMEDT